MGKGPQGDPNLLGSDSLDRSDPGCPQHCGHLEVTPKYIKERALYSIIFLFVNPDRQVYRGADELQEGIIYHDVFQR